MILVAAGIQFITASQSVAYYTDVKLRCSATGLPAPDVQWTRNGVVLKKEQSTAILNLNSVTEYDEGVYRCAVNNSGGSNYSDVKITVVGRSFAISTVRADQTNCTVTSDWLR